MLEISLLLAALLALAVALSYKTSDFFRKSQALDSAALLHLADDQLRQYVVANGRLPCPDLTGDGISDACPSGTQKGYLPYITLGMAENNYVAGEVPMLYGIYNDGPGSLSLASTNQTFVPDYASESNAPVSMTYARNVFDFCASLRVIENRSSNSALSMAGQYSAAFALAVPGNGNRDGLAAGWAGGPAINAQYDGLNATHPSRFELPEKAVGPSYDDKTAYRTARDLFDDLRCESMIGSVDLLTESLTFEYQTRDFANGNYDSVRHSLKLNAAGSALALWQLGQSIAGIASASEVLGVSAGLLATVSATCPLPPWITCALIPVYATAVTNASVGLGLSVGAAVTSGASLGLQITSTVMYALLTARTTSPVNDPVPSLSSLPPERVTALRDAYVASNGKARTAYQNLPANPPDLSALGNAVTQTGTQLNTNLDRLADSDLQTLMRDRLNGSTSTCVSTDTTCTARTIQTLVDGQLVSSTIYTRDNLGATYGPGVQPALDSYQQALEQAGAVPTANLPSSEDSTPLPAVNLLSPADALTSANALITRYGSLMSATEVFDTRHLDFLAAQAAVNAFGTPTPETQAAYDAAVLERDAAASARTRALGELRNEMGAGYSNWDYSGTSSLCGTGGCAWMRGGTVASGNNTTLASTSSGVFNDFLVARKAQADAAGYANAKKEADGLASQAWLDRNGYKTALCASQSPSVSWIGGTGVPSPNPVVWDASENLLVEPVVGLNCSGSARALDTTDQSNEAREAERVKYCTVGAVSYDATLCAVYSGDSPTRTTVQGVRPIVDTLIQKGIVR